MTNVEKILLEKLLRELQDIKVILQENVEINEFDTKKLNHSKASEK